ncbi:unnamed protein product [Cylicocyclus nassatus]|uniref:Apple domain-containing protein n=1 Tax=Cylicocyclus nassatus TaxID=53992 RepID=A0AA36DPE0_CYLNA|nr:unnamed protein product [Cylicocyclus nassatus]
MSSATVFIVLVLVETAINVGVFRYSPNAGHGYLVYDIYLEDKAMCLRACYEEVECEVVNYEENTRSCAMYRGGNSTEPGYILSRGETDAACTLIEISDTDIAFQKIPSQDLAKVECNVMSDVAAISTYENSTGYRFFILRPNNISEYWEDMHYRLLFSKKKEETCTPVPIFHKANYRRLYFGEIYNTTGYYFYNAYAYANYCVSPEGECLGVMEIQEYVDKFGFHFY